MDNENKNKNSMREDREEVQTIKTKIYNYFYYILKDKKEINRASSCIFIILEMIQLLSYAFADPGKYPKIKWTYYHQSSAQFE